MAEQPPPKTESEIKPIENILNEPAKIPLQLGDIIQIYDATNNLINEKIYYVNYLDTKKIKLIDTANLTEILLPILTSESGQNSLGDGTITQIDLLYRNDKKGFARQHDLLPETWVNIHFKDDVPFIVTAQITNLEGDMIELRTYPSGETLYINFDYKGIPEDLPIQIERRMAPAVAEKPPSGVGKEPSPQVGEQQLSPQTGVSVAKERLHSEVEESPQPPATFRREVLEANQIVFGDILGSVEETVAVEKEKRRYDLKSQTNDLLEEMLSKILPIERTPNVLNKLHNTVSRIIQLRDSASLTDTHGNIIGVKKPSAEHKPLVQHLLKDDKWASVPWILPIVKNSRKIYPKIDKDGTEEIDEDEHPDITIEDTMTDVDTITNLVANAGASGTTTGDDTNKYAFLAQRIANIMVPFSNVECTQDLLECMTPTSVVVDNLDNMTSTVVANDTTRVKQWLTSTCTNGQTRIQLEMGMRGKFKKGAANRVQMTANDRMCTHGLLVMPETIIRFMSLGTSPNTSILERAIVNDKFVRLSKILKSKNVANIKVDCTGEKCTELEYTDETFFNKIGHYFSSEPLNEESEEEPAQSSFDATKMLNAIIPRSRTFFHFAKPHIQNAYSVSDALKSLDAFKVYFNDVTFRMYGDITRFIRDNIRNYNRQLVANQRAFSIGSIKKPIRYPNKLIENLRGDSRIEHEVVTNYGEQELNETPTEFLKRIITTDYGELYNVAVAFENIALTNNDDLSVLFELDSDALKQKLRENRKIYVMTKRYHDISEIVADNKPDAIVFFDREFDKIPYEKLDDLLIEFKKERPPNASTEEYTQNFKTFLLTKANPHVVESLLSGNQKVQEGQYAMLVSSTSDAVVYYIRRGGKWIEDKSVNADSFMQDSDTICLVQKDLILAPKTGECESIQTNSVATALKQILAQFDKNYKITREQLREALHNHLQKCEDNFGILRTFLENARLARDDAQYKIGLMFEDTQKVQSPFVPLRENIMGFPDFVKRQYYIVQFAQKYCRAATADENQYWLYCVKTNTQLLPTFVPELAGVFMNSPENYERTVNQIIKIRGKLSSDGDKWVDEHSGYIIRRIDFLIGEEWEEGERAGREVMEEEVGAGLMAAATERESVRDDTNMPIPKKLSPLAQTILNIVNAMTTFMGITTFASEQTEAVISVVTALMEDTKVIVKEKDYAKLVDTAAARGKKLPEYSVVYGSTLINLTLGMILVAIQTSIPPIKTKKSFPNCNRSFSGYPIGGEGDTSALNYIACVAYHIRSQTKPWNVLLRLKQDGIAQNIKTLCDKFLLNHIVVQTKMSERRQYDTQNPETEEVPEEHSILRWHHFYPPIVPFKVTRDLQIPTESFERALIHELRNGMVEQYDRVNVLRGKAQAFSLAIQESISKIVSKKDVLLRSSAKPYLDNACCNETSASGAQLTIFQYFINEDVTIAQNNKMVLEIGNTLKNVVDMSRASMIFNTILTKRLYPPIPVDFNEETIYRGFMVYCKMASIVPLPPDLVPFCQQKPEFGLAGLSTQEIIQKLKLEGRNYTLSDFMRLLQAVNRLGIKPVKYVVPSSCDFELTKTVEKLVVADDTTFSPVLRGFLETRYRCDSASACEHASAAPPTGGVREIKNYLQTNIAKMQRDLLAFISKTSVTNATKRRIMLFVEQFMENWASPDLTKNFIQQSANLLVKTFPNMILNKINWTEETVVPNAYWEMTGSYRHVSKFKKFMVEQYKFIVPFYGNAQLNGVLGAIELQSSALVDVIKTLINFDDVELTKMINHYCWLDLFNNYMIVANNPENIVVENEDLDENEAILPVDNSEYLSGNLAQLKEITAKLLVGYMQTLMDLKELVNVSHDVIEERSFYLRELEKQTVTDRLKELEISARKLDMEMRSHKLGSDWQARSGLVHYDVGTFETEYDIMRNIANKELMMHRKSQRLGVETDDLVSELARENAVNEQVDEDNQLPQEGFDDGSPDVEGEDAEDYY